MIILYKRHKYQVMIIAILSIIIYIFSDKSYLKIQEVFYTIFIPIIIYTISIISLLINKKLRFEYLKTQDENIKTKSMLGVITTYYKLGYISCLMILILSYIVQIIYRTSNSIIISYSIYFINFITFTMININFLIAYYILNFILNK